MLPWQCRSVQACFYDVNVQHLSSSNSRSIHWRFFITKCSPLWPHINYSGREEEKEEEGGGERRKEERGKGEEKGEREREGKWESWWPVYNCSTCKQFKVSLQWPHDLRAMPVYANKWIHDKVGFQVQGLKGQCRSIQWHPMSLSTG